MKSAGNLQGATRSLDYSGADLTVEGDGFECVRENWFEAQIPPHVPACLAV
jgi:hypothetical protein